MIEKIIKDELEKFYPEMIELRRYIHMHPEVSFNEKNTARFIKEYLEKIDFKIDKFNLSDIFEYMSVENYAKLMEIIYKNCSDNALLAYWNLVVKRNSEMEELKNQFSKRFKRLKEIDQELHKRDKTFFYTDFVIERVIK